MEPTVREGDRLWVEPTRHVTRGEIVVVRDPEDDGRLLVKRVGACGGDRILVTRTGVRPAEPSEGVHPPTDALEALVVPPDAIFLVSDSPSGARDSRRFGPVGLDRLIGRAWFRYFPPARRGDL